MKNGTLIRICIVLLNFRANSRRVITNCLSLCNSCHVHFSEIICRKLYCKLSGGTFCLVTELW